MVDWSTCPVRIAPSQDRLIVNVRALYPTISFRPVRVPNFPLVMFSTDAGSFSERRGFFMVDRWTCPVRIAPSQDRLFANGSTLSPTISFRSVRFPILPAVVFPTDAGSLSERRGFSMADWSICPVRIAPFEDRLNATMCTLSPTISFRPVRVPIFPVVICSTDALFQSAGNSIWLTGRLALFVTPPFLAGGPPPSTVSVCTICMKHRTLSTPVGSSEFSDFTVRSLSFSRVLRQAVI